MLKSAYAPQGDQPAAIDALVRGVQSGMPSQVLLGVTGSGKTYTMANVIANLQRPALVIAHNKTLAAQLCSEFREYFPDNAVEYFVSYYDYFQPEAYIPSTGTYIEKESDINEEIDRLRHSATSALNERRDVIIVASVSCIYALGAPEEYFANSVSLRPGMRVEQRKILQKLVEIQYERNDMDFVRGTFRVRGDVLEIIPADHKDKAIRVEFFDDEVERISEISVVTGEILARLSHVAIFPATHYVATQETLHRAIHNIEQDLQDRISVLRQEDKLLEAQRLTQRTQYDMEMLQEIGYCSGVENYSRYFDGRIPGQAPFTLMDYFPKDFLLFIDESHVTVPQIRAMYNGDKSRKSVLVDFGFRLPSAFDNRPLRFEEFLQRRGQTIHVSATPADYELQEAGQIVEQVIRPTGLVDPEVIVRPVQGQVDDLMYEVRQVVQSGHRVLVTTLTKKMAEGLTEYLTENEFRVRYLHSDIDTLERMEIIRSLRLGEFDVLVGINLLREGLDLPEVALVAILDADKEGFLRSTTSLIQTVGRAARNVQGRVIMYADRVTDSMQRAIAETERRRQKQMEHNQLHGIVPKSIERAVHEGLGIGLPAQQMPARKKHEIFRDIGQVESQMRQAALALDFERAAQLRDILFALKAQAEKTKE